MVDNIKAAISAMCKAHPAGRLGMAADLGMNIDTFHNHMYRAGPIRCSTGMQ
uniref:hypothetical protein n=1 Tax=Cronobacter dublinensis TaxID=413497 RepID=UPI001319F384|nr:hypothetical protein [Cronobacter dublinensis]